MCQENSSSTGSKGCGENSSCCGEKTTGAESRDSINIELAHLEVSRFCAETESFRAQTSQFSVETERLDILFKTLQREIEAMRSEGYIAELVKNELTKLLKNKI